MIQRRGLRQISTKLRYSGPDGQSPEPLRRGIVRVHEWPNDTPVFMENTNVKKNFETLEEKLPEKPIFLLSPAMMSIAADKEP